MSASVGPREPLTEPVEELGGHDPLGDTADASTSFIEAVMAEPRAITLTRDLMMSLMMPEPTRERLEMSSDAPSMAPIRVLEYPSSVLRKTGEKREDHARRRRPEKPAERQRPTTAVVRLVVHDLSEVSAATVRAVDAPASSTTWCAAHPSATDHPSSHPPSFFFLFLPPPTRPWRICNRARTVHLAPPESFEHPPTTRPPKSPAGSGTSAYENRARSMSRRVPECHPARRQRTTPDAIGARAPPGGSRLFAAGAVRAGGWGKRGRGGTGGE